MLKKVLVILLSILCAVPAEALLSTSSFRHYSTAEGLPSNCIRDIAQDSCGFIWFATDGGLARFDGRQFRTFAPASVASLPKMNNFVTAIAVMKNEVWVGTDNGLLRYDPDMECLSVPELVYPEDNIPRISGDMRSLVTDRTGNIWIGMSTGGIYRVSPDMIVTHYSIPALSNCIGKVFVDSQNEVWVSGIFASGGLFRFDSVRDSFRKVALTAEGRELNICSMAITEDKSGCLWVGLWSGGLVRYDPVSGRSSLAATNAACDLFHIHSLAVTPENRLLIGVDRGLVSYDPSTGSYNLYEKDELRPASLSGPFVYPIMRDKEGGVWIGTFYAGVNYLPPQTKIFESARHSRFVNSVSGDIISVFCEDNSGNIYIGSDDGGLCRFTPETGEYRRISLGGDQSRENVHALCMDGDDLWIGTYAGGVKVYDTVAGKLKYDFSGHTPEGGDAVTSSYAIFRDKDAGMWVATMDAVMVYDRERKLFREVRDIGALTCDIEQDKAGNLWFATQGKGLFRYHPGNRVWKNYRTASGKGSLPNNHVSGVDFDENGTMWVATGTGICRYRPETDDFEPLDLGDAGYTILLMKTYGSEIWAGTANGLLRYRPDTGVSTYTSMDGLVYDQFCLNASLESSDGRLYLGTVAGYTYFSPEDIGINEIAPSLRFTGLDIGGQPVEVGDKRLPRSLNTIDVLELDHEDYAFSISFAAMSFANPGRNSYAYKLEGFDKDWIEAGNENKATYTNLPPGDYTMRVRASNNDKVWNSAGISMPIHILPPWYGTWIMKLVYILGVLGLISIATYFVMSRNERKHRAEIDKVSAAKEMEVYQAKVNFFTTIAHEIRTPVSLIIGPLENIMQSSHNFTGQENDDLDIIYRNSQRLLFLVNQLLDFKKVEKLALEARFSRHDIPALVASTAKRFQPSLKHKGAELDIEMPTKDFCADVDAEALTKLVSNLLNNARKFTKDRVTVTCAENAEAGVFSISVGDNGVGISQDDIKRIFKPFVQVGTANATEGGTGLGLSIVMRVVKAHGGKINVDSVPGEGSLFTVTLPLHQDNVATSEDIREGEADDSGNDSATESWTEESGILSDKPVMLVVDDNVDLLRFVSKNFADQYNVIAVASGEEALERMSCQSVDIIVSDWMMPGMSGVELCMKVRADMATSHIPFVLLTAKTDNYSKIEGLNCGADAYVEKPFSVSYLKARLRNLGEMRNLLRRKFSSTPLEPIETLAPTQLDSDFLKKLTAIIEDNFSNQDLSVDFLARSMGVSRSGLYSKIKTLANITPNELIQITRLKKAAQLLAENKYRVSEICYMVGFNSPSYFAKCFQKQFGMKPGEFTPHSCD